MTRTKVIMSFIATLSDDEVVFASEILDDRKRGFQTFPFHFLIRSLIQIASALDRADAAVATNLFPSYHDEIRKYRNIFDRDYPSFQRPVEHLPDLEHPANAHLKQIAQSLVDSFFRAVIEIAKGRVDDAEKLTLFYRSEAVLALFRVQALRGLLPNYIKYNE